MKRHFIHIPKNGGMTVRRAPQLANKITLSTPDNHINKEYTANLLKAMKKAGEHHGYQHARWRDLKESIRNGRCFAVVRNPWSKVVSRYLFSQKTSKQKFGGVICTFEEFLEQRYEYGDKDFFWHRAIKGWFPQKDHVTDEQGNLRVDILRLEHLNHDLNKYFNMNVSFQLRNISNTKRIDYRSFYTEETRKIIEEWYSEDIEFFGFTFDGTATKNIWYKKEETL